MEMKKTKQTHFVTNKNDNKCYKISVRSNNHFSYVEA